MSPKCHFRGHLFFSEAKLSSNEWQDEPLGGRQVFLVFAPRPCLSLSETRPKDLLKNLSENACYSLQDKILGVGVCFEGEEVAHREELLVKETTCYGSNEIMQSAS